MIELLPVFFILIFIEVLLSIDNALLNAAFASEFEDEEKKKMLRNGIIIETGFRILTLVLMSLIIQNIWLKFLCGAYLIIIGLKHVSGYIDKEGHLIRRPESRKAALFQMTAANRALSINNVFLVASFTQKIELIIGAVLISIILVATSAPYLAKKIRQYQGLSHAVFSIILFFGVIMMYEAVTKSYVDNSIKITIIVVTLLFAVVYKHSSLIRTLSLPVLIRLQKVANIPASFFVKLFTFIKRIYSRV